MIPVPTGSTNAWHGKPPKSRSMMAESSSSNPPDLQGTHATTIHRPKIFQKILGKAGLKAIFALEEFSHDSDEISHFPA